MQIKLKNNVVIELVVNRSGEWSGLGAISAGGVALRNGARPITVRLDTPQGILYTRFLVEKINRSADRVDIILKAIGMPWERGEYHDDYAQPLVWLHPHDETITDRLTLVLRPVALEVGGRQWQGFSYAFEFASRSRQIHRLLTHATWEIGGRITGNTYLSQGQCNLPVYRGATNTVFTTACLRTLDQYGSPQGNSFQLGPRGGLLQTFDFQHARQGVLWQWWPKFDSISSLIESPRGSDELHVIDEYRFPLARRAHTLPKWVLFTPGELVEHEARDLWWDCSEYVTGAIRRQVGITPTVVVPALRLRYETSLDGRRTHDDGTLWDWRQTTVKLAARHRGRLRLKLAGVEVDHAELPYAIADHVLPQLARQGIRRLLHETFSESDVTVLGLERKLDRGVHGNLFCTSVCGTHRFFPSEFWGGIKRWRYMYEKGRKLGIEIGAWFAPHFSPRAPIFVEHPEYRMIDTLGLPAAGGCGFQMITTADWNTGIREHVLADLRRWKEEGGLDFLWVDSYSNLGLVQMNYAERMRTNYTAFAGLLADAQRMGIRTLEFECTSPMGVGFFGLADLRGDLMGQNRAVAGQNDFGWWVGAEDMAFNCRFNVMPRKRSDKELARLQFRFMANRSGLLCQGYFDIQHRLPDWWARLNHLYNQALPHMQGRRRLLPDGAGVRWETNDGELIWTFKNCPTNQPCYRLDGKTESTWMKPVLPAWNVFRSTHTGGI